LSKGRFKSWASPRYRPPMIGNRPAAVRDDESQGRKVGEQVTGQKLHEGGGIGVDVVRAGGMEFGLHDELTCTMAGTSSSTIFSYIGYQCRSVSGGEVQWPPDGSGFKLHPMNPSSVTQRSSSAALFTGATPGDWGN